MAEWDDLETRLKDLGRGAAELVDDPLDPSVVRGLGSRRRRRRRVALAVAVVIMVVTGGVAVYGATLPPTLLPPTPAGSPTVSTSPDPGEGEPDARGRRLPDATGRPDRRAPAPPTYPTSTPSSPSASGSPTPTSTPTPSEEPSATPTGDPEPEPTEEPSGADPTQTAPGQPGGGQPGGGQPGGGQPGGGEPSSGPTNVEGSTG